jgi:hypothetical protein
VTSVRKQPWQDGEVRVHATPADVYDAGSRKGVFDWKLDEWNAQYAAAPVVEEPAAPIVAYRKVGTALYEVVRDGQAIGRVVRTTPAHVTFSARWASYSTTGERLSSGHANRDAARDALLRIVDERAEAEVPNLPAEHWQRMDAARDARAATPAPVVALGHDGLVHLMSEDLLDACGTAPDGRLAVVPGTTPERITCPACRRLVTEADVPPPAPEEERATVRIRAAELRAGDLVVDSLGERQYAAFDTADTPSSQHVEVWTAVADQERGLPPRIRLHRDRELRVSRVVPAGSWDALIAGRA